MTALPRSLDDLRGLRAARWIRESSAGQYDRYGPDSQRAEIDPFARQYGLLDSGLEWLPAHSGRTVWQSAEMEAMLAAAARGEFDVLLIGYYDRWQRNLRRFLELIEDRLHPAGVALVMCDSRLLSSNPRDWQRMKEQANRAEDYSLDLGRRIRDGFAAKFNRDYGDQGGTTPLGFRREADPPHRLLIDPATIGQAVALFEAYATGQHSFTSLGAEVGMAPERVREILQAPIFNGWHRRGKRSREEQRKPAPWRYNPPVSDELWDRVQQVRRAKTHGGGPRRSDRTDLLGGLLFCPCGRHIKANGTNGSGVIRAHPAPCKQWGPRVTYPVSTWEEPLSAQAAQIDLSPATMAAVVAVLGQAEPRADELALRRLDRERQRAADAFAQGRMPLEQFTRRITELDAEQAAVNTHARTAPATIPADAAVAHLKDLGRSWQDADDSARANLLHAIYARVEVRGAEFVAVTLTPEAERHGLALALPEKVASARPAGIEPAT